MPPARPRRAGRPTGAHAGLGSTWACRTYDGGAGVGQALVEAASPGTLYGLRRPGLRAQGRGHHRPASETAQHAAVFCVDEKTAIQALDRLDPVLPLSPGRAERHGFEYYRHGTLSLYAAFDTRTGTILGRTAERHTSAEFVAFSGRPGRPPTPGPGDSCDPHNLSAHKTKRVDAFLAEHSQVRLHFISPRPTRPGSTRW